MENKVQNNFKLQFFLIFLLGAIIASSASKIEAQYESDKPYKIFKIGQSLTLQCKPKSSSDGEKIYWLKDDKNVTEIDHFNNKDPKHYRLNSKEGKFIIEKTRENDAGNYSCNIENEKPQVFEVLANVIVKVQSEIQVKEGDRVELICNVKGTNPVITWTFRPEIIVTENDDDDSDEDNSKDNQDGEALPPLPPIEITNDERFALIDNEDIENSILVIKSVKLSDRGYYKCRAINEKYDSMEAAESEAYIRVKSKTAAIWPAIGIIAQIVVLAIIIIISENRRNQNEVDESDTDESPEKKEDSNFIRSGH